MNKIKLLSEEDLITTGPVDHANWNYKPFIKYIQVERFKLCLKLINNKIFTRLLEIGYGSGIFFPTLDTLASELYGIDIHKKNIEVEKLLRNKNLKGSLLSGSAVKMPFPDDYFDLIISISAIEFIEDLDLACQEILRVLKEDGTFIVITPGFSPVLDFGLKFLTNKNAKTDYDDRRKCILPTLKKYFNTEKKINFPRYMIPSLRLYNGLKLTKLKNNTSPK